MNLKAKSKILDAEGIKRTLLRISHEIIEKNHGTKDLAVIGIKYRGAYLAERIVKNLEKIEEKGIPVGALDITLYRDDLTEIAEQPVVHATEIDFDIAKLVRRVAIQTPGRFLGAVVRYQMDAAIRSDVSVELAQYVIDIVIKPQHEYFV